jgi:predicted ATP-grasp superfamily ATP-dependent carboligase
MMNTVKLSIEAVASNTGKDLVNVIHHAAVNSISYVIDMKQASGNMLQFTIKTTSDRLESLCHRLVDTGLLLKDNAVDVLMNASGQYSLYRDIHLDLNVESF